RREHNHEHGLDRNEPLRVELEAEQIEVDVAVSEQVERRAGLLVPGPEQRREREEYHHRGEALALLHSEALQPPPQQDGDPGEMGHNRQQHLQQHVTPVDRRTRGPAQTWWLLQTLNGRLQSLTT